MAELLSPDELGQLIPLSREVQNLSDGSTLGENEAVVKLLERFGIAISVDDLNNQEAYRLQSGDENVLDYKVAYEVGPSTGFAVSSAPVLFAMLRTVVRALPSDMRNEQVLSRIDLRPYIDAMRGKTVSGRNFAGMMPDFDVSVEITPERADAYTKAFTDTLTTSLVPTGTGDYVENKQQAATTAGTYTPGVSAITPEMANAADVTIDEDEIRRLFTESGTKDILYLTDLLEASGVGDEINPTVVLEEPMLGTLPSEAARFQGPTMGGTPLQGAKLNYRAAVRYLYDGNATPSQILRMQQKMAAAGLFDAEAGGYIPGDAFDQNTFKAWTTLLGTAYQRQMSLDDTLSQMAAERRAKLPNLNQKVNRMVFDAAARNVIGRGLDDAEEAELIAFLTGLRDRQGLASMGADQQTGFGEQEVSRFIANKYSDEAQGLAEVAGQDAVSEALKGFV